MADRIYIMNSPGFQSLTTSLSTAITNNGHTITQNTSGVYTLPAGFTTTCVDPINGYDWLCFFGNEDYTPLLSQIQAFIDLGGKVLYQYEVSCCTVSSSAAATIASGLTGLSITPNASAGIATTVTGWVASNIHCCINITGAAYKGMDGVPIANQLQATANLGGSTPLISVCPNFAMVFATNNFVGTAHQGGFIGVGDFNAWFNGLPTTSAVYTPLVNFIFPNDTSTCYLFPPGCLQTYNGFSTSGIILDLGNDTTLCAGQSLLLNAANAGATYLWQNGSTNSTLNVTAPGTYWVQVTSACGQATDTIHITNQLGPIVQLGNDTTICQGNSLLLNANNPGSTFLWQNGSTNSTLTTNAAGTYWVQVSNLCGVTADTIHISLTPLPIVNLGNDTSFCAGQSLVLNAGNPGLPHLWQNGSTSSTFTVNQSGLYWVKVGTGCSTTDSIQITILPKPIINLGLDQTLCYGETALLNATYPGANYSWQDGSSNATFNASSSGLYWVELNLNNCTFRDSVLVNVGPFFTVDLGSDFELCSDSIVQLNATSTVNVNYLWQDNSTNPIFNATQTGMYWVELSQGNCTKKDTINIVFNEVPRIDLGPDKSLCPEESVVLDATTLNATYLWQDFSKNPTYTVHKTGLYIVEVKVKNCIGIDTVYVDYLQENCQCSVYIPNAFSPNEDGINDELHLIHVINLNLKDFKIYNRWGNEVFETNVIGDGWNGNYKGISAEIGTYFYVLKYTCNFDGKEYVLKGDITLIR